MKSQKEEAELSDPNVWQYHIFPQQNTLVLALDKARSFRRE